MKSLLAASLATLSVTGAYAAEVQAPAADYMPEATLDGLKGQTIPDTDPALQYPGSAYSMTKIQEGGDKPAGDNIVTKFTYDAQTQTMTPIYYRLDLKNTVYGEGDSERYFKYTDVNGRQQLTQADNAEEADFTVKYNTPTQNDSPMTIGENDTSYKDSVINFESDGYVFEDSNHNYLLWNRAGAEVGEIKANIINSTGSEQPSSAFGIYNEGSIAEVSGSFIFNKSNPNATLGAAPIVNASGGHIGNIEALFDDNHFYSSGAIWNQSDASIDSINSDFIYNSATSRGGAIKNEGQVGNIAGDFIGNFANGGGGGAIYNTAEIKNITGNFVNNHLAVNVRAQSGGAIYNEGTIGAIAGDFIGNYVTTTQALNFSAGGAIANKGSIASITGDFINNSAQYGAAISNGYGGVYSNTASTNFDAYIAAIKGNFIGNKGPVIENVYNSSKKSGKINSISGNFIGNMGNAIGGGIIDSITGLFVDNAGTCIKVDGVTNINADFINNNTGIFVGSDIKNISGNFIDNYLTSNYSSAYTGYGQGGAAISSGDYQRFSVGSVTGTFTGNTSINKLTNDVAMILGGAVYNHTNNTIQDFKADFTGNSAIGGGAKGGAIANPGNIVNLEGNFVDNSATGVTECPESVITDFSDTSSAFGNYSTPATDTPSVEGGAIFSNGSISELHGRFDGNRAEAKNNLSAVGGAISNAGVISNVTAVFVNNHASATTGNAYGGAISASGLDYSVDYSTQTVKLHITSFNYENADTGEVYTLYQLSINDSPSSKAVLDEYLQDGYKLIVSTTEEGGMSLSDEEFNQMKESASANIEAGRLFESVDDLYSKDDLAAEPVITPIITDSGLNITNSTFIGNYAQSVSGDARGGALHYNNSNDVPDPNALSVLSITYTNTQTGESVTFYGVLGPDDKYSALTKDEIQQYLDKGYKLSSSVINDGNMQIDPDKWDAMMTEMEAGVAAGNLFTVSLEDIFDADAFSEPVGKLISNSSFIGNYAKSESGEAKGGAIYSEANLQIEAKDGYQSIYMGSSDTTLSFKMTNGGSVYMADNIDGVIKDSGDGTKNGYNVNIKGDDINKTTFYMLNDIRNADVSVGTTTLNTINNQSHTYDFNSFTLTGDTNMAADVDLANETMDRFTANSYGEHQGNLNVVGMNLLSDAPENRPVTEIYFAQVGLKDHVTNGTGELPDGTQTTAYTPIYKYHVMYDNRDDGGYFMQVMRLTRAS